MHSCGNPRRQIYHIWRGSVRGAARAPALTERRTLLELLQHLHAVIDAAKNHYGKNRNRQPADHPFAVADLQMFVMLDLIGETVKHKSPFRSALLGYSELFHS